MDYPDTDYWPAPAKLNLMLRVVGRRSDGYHLLQTVFRFIDFSDQLRFELRGDGQICRKAGNQQVPESEDLIVRAARLLQRVTGVSQGVDISIEKKIPAGGGLGGGSSDAATVLMVLNRLWDVDLPLDQLAGIGLELGADVPVFLKGHSAWAEGVGEQLTAIQLPEAWYLVLIPGCHVTTADVFRDPELTRNAPRTTIRDFLAGGQVNDCLPVVLKHYPEVADAFSWLSKFAKARLTGTGSCIFAEFDSETAAYEVLSEMPDRFKGFVAKGIDHSPLMQRLAS
ncbi:MAG: 4-(cytidine 5'-diphospho)-2-C-methyl-D-erythritol kinase [Sedimenticola sp.]|nr:4-(cytidine 5'-diphospho)-2-C-methyl-D-erythritol kinase [Sedimenticola sp.]